MGSFPNQDKAKDRPKSTIYHKIVYTQADKRQWITEASAKTFRLARKTGRDPFNFDSIMITHTFLEEVVIDNGTNIDLINEAGRYPGSWTVPVCDTSTWGMDWNWDYTDPKYGDKDWLSTIPGYQGEGRALYHPPCLCGKWKSAFLIEPSQH